MDTGRERLQHCIFQGMPYFKSNLELPQLTGDLNLIAQFCVLKKYYLLFIKIVDRLVLYKN